MWGDIHLEWQQNSTINGVEGLLSVWDNIVFNLVQSKVGSGYIILEGFVCEANQLVTVVNIYPSCVLAEKRDM